LEGAVVGSVIETNIEGIDREFKVTKAQKASFYNKSGDMFTHPLEVMKNHSFKFNAELKSHYELVGRDLARFYESKGEDYKTKLKILFQYGQRARL
jgi:capsule polysaccharide modification protein KpsS